MNITRIRIEELFGELNYEIPIKFSEVATIIYAPNGYGKTTALEIISAVFNLNLDALSSQLFSKVLIDFADGNHLEICRKVLDAAAIEAAIEKTPRFSAHGQRLEETPTVHFVISLFNRAGEIMRTQQEPPPENTPAESPARSAQEAFSNLRRVSSSLWRDMRTGRIYRREDLPRRFGGMLPNFQPEEWLRNLVELNHTTLIKTKRLDAEIVEREEDDETVSRRERRQPVPSVVKHSREMSEAIQVALGEFSNLSQKLDRLFPRRLMTALNSNVHQQTDTGSGLKELDNKYRRIVEAGILEKDRIEPLSPAGLINPHTQKVMALYIQDQREKLEVFDDLLTKIETLRDLINRRFQRKRFFVNRQDGYQIVSAVREGRPIPLEKLSSGEQHELVLFHSLLFNMRKGSLVMIDEPEISLHVAWQEEFLRDLTRISLNTGVHFLIATHSPQIISDRWDLSVDLAKAPQN